MTDPALTAAELADLLGKTEEWVIRNGPRLPHHRIGRSVRFFPDDVAAILEITKRRPVVRDGDTEDMRPIPTRRRSA